MKIPKPEPGEPEASPTHMAQPVTGSPQSLVRNKGKQPVSPQISSKAKRPPLDRPSQALQIKEPKGDTGVIPKQKQAKVKALIIPKDEPFTDDMPSVEPLAVVLPGNFLSFCFVNYLASSSFVCEKLFVLGLVFFTEILIFFA